MRIRDNARSISYLKTNAADVLAALEQGGDPLIVTQNGEAKAVLQDLRSYEQTQQTLTLLKLLAMSQRDVQTGQVEPAHDAIARLRRNLHAS